LNSANAVVRAQFGIGSGVTQYKRESPIIPVRGTLPFIKLAQIPVVYDAHVANETCDAAADHYNVAGSEKQAASRVTRIVVQNLKG
jgi:hypothetical protein